jgi:hypothetical protein
MISAAQILDAWTCCVLSRHGPSATLSHLCCEKIDRDDPDLSQLRIHRPKPARSARSTWVERARGTAVPLRKLPAGKSRS